MILIVILAIRMIFRTTGLLASDYTASNENV